METISMPEGCYWQRRAGVYSVYFTYPVVGSNHDFLGGMTDLLGQTYSKSEVTKIANQGREKKMAELQHGH